MPISLADLFSIVEPPNASINSFKQQKSSWIDGFGGSKIVKGSVESLLIRKPRYYRQVFFIYKYISGRCVSISLEN